jgi:hypothetical protein
MLSYTYLFLSLLKRAFSEDTPAKRFPRPLLQLVSVVGLLTAIVGFAMAFVPSRQIESIFSFELKIIVTLGLFLGLAASLFFFYSKRKPERSFEVV